MNIAMSSSVAVIMPVYNEADCIEQVIAEWHAAVSQIPCATLLILNDGSTDNSLKILNKLAPKYPKLKVIDKSNTGHAQTCMMGYQWAIDSGYGYVFQTDSDGQTLPSEFIGLWENKGDRDFIFGERKVRGDGFSRFVIQEVLRWCIFIVSRQWVRDANVPFRLMRCDKLRTILPHIPENFFLGNALLTYHIASAHEISWVPISFKSRYGGVPSVRFFNFFSKGIEFLWQFYQATKTTGKE